MQTNLVLVNGWFTVYIYWPGANIPAFSTMKRIEFTSPADGDIIVDSNLQMLRILFLYVGAEFWNSGSGDSCLDFYDEKKEAALEILFSNPHGFYLRYKAKGQDFHTSNDSDYSVVTKIYVGGNPLVLPIKFFIDREKAFDAVHYFCQTGDRINTVHWIEDDKIEWDWEKYLV